jgi:putative oxidoreductase
MARLIRNTLIITRYMLALVFLAAGASMIDQYSLAQAYMVSTGLPGALLPWFILVVIAAALSLISGSRLQWAALAMALLAVTSALLLPADFADHAQTIAFFRNTSIAAVLLLMAAVVAGCRSKGGHVSIQDRSVHADQAHPVKP